MTGSSCHEQGTVTHVFPNNKAKVVVERGEACGSCVAKGACQTLGGPKQDVTLFVENPLGAAPGDIVQLTLEETAIIKASAVLYLIPALGLILGAVAGLTVAKVYRLPLDPGTIIGTLIGLLMGLGISFVLGRWMSRNKSVVPRLTAIIEKSTI